MTQKLILIWTLIGAYKLKEFTPEIVQRRFTLYEWRLVIQDVQLCVLLLSFCYLVHICIMLCFNFFLLQKLEVWLKSSVFRLYNPNLELWPLCLHIFTTIRVFHSDKQSTKVITFFQMKKSNGFYPAWVLQVIQKSILVNSVFRIRRYCVVKILEFTFFLMRYT